MNVCLHGYENAFSFVKDNKNYGDVHGVSLFSCRGFASEWIMNAPRDTLDLSHSVVTGTADAHKF